MEWYLSLSLVIVLLLALFASGLQVALVFILIDLLGLYFLVGGWPALSLLPGSIINSIASYPLGAVPLFVLMGEILFRSGVAAQVLDALGKWIGALPARLSLVTVVGAAVFGAISGSSMATTATLSATLAPEMKERGYSPEMIAGPIIGAGGLAMIIPPSAMAVLLGTIGHISIGHLLIGGIVPGLLIATGYFLVILLRVWWNPKLVPQEVYVPPTLRERLRTLNLLIPVGFLLFMVLGLMFLGVATPSESAALGALAAFVVAAAYGKLAWEAVRVSVMETIKITAGIFLIIAGSAAFSQVLAFTGSTRGLVDLITQLDMAPLMVVFFMMLVLIVMGMFMDQISMMLITLPVYMPIITSLGLDPLWFGIIVLINLEVANETPPFGVLLYIGQSFMPGYSTMQIINAVIPFTIVDLVVMGLLLVWADLALWLPRLMSTAG